MIGDLSCTTDLLKTLNTDDLQLHEATIRSLIQMKTAPCLEALTNYLDRDIQDKPIEALIEAFTIYQAWEVCDKLKPFLNSNSERVVSATSAYFYAYTNEKKYLTRVFQLLQHENRFVRQSAAFDLARIATIECTNELLAANIPNNIKMFAIKSILNASLESASNQDKDEDEDEDDTCTHKETQLFNKLDQLVEENFSGNLLLDQDNTQPNRSGPSTQEQTNTSLIDLLLLLKSPSLQVREAGIKGLSQHDQSAELVELYFSESDQDIKMGLIKAMAASADSKFLPALIDAIGVDIGNHCQGNIRRVAARALGFIGRSEQNPSKIQDSIVEKLRWTLQNPDDWGLRYSAVLALEDLQTSAVNTILMSAEESETDLVVRTRMRRALSTTTSTT
tara:strand:+ start:619 stop:1794 length:1176 start_codon:yes stop_codon:yes gene_type:complete